MTLHRQNLNYIVPDDDHGSVGENGALTARQDAFAIVWARTGNKAAAYRSAYTVAPNTAPNTIWSNSCRIASLPQVAKRYREIQEQAALETIVHIREALQWQFDIATANPNEVVYIAKRCCRYCYGYNHAYQWKDENEYMTACVKAMDSGETPPTDEGGYNFTHANEPALECPLCLGDGVSDVVINDTTKLQGKALKLFKGVDYKNGEWVVQLHDQQKAWEMVCRMLGGFNDKLNLIAGSGTVAKNLPQGALTEQEAARSYLDLLG